MYKWTILRKLKLIEIHYLKSMRDLKRKTNVIVQNRWRGTIQGISKLTSSRYYESSLFKKNISYNYFQTARYLVCVGNCLWIKGMHKISNGFIKTYAWHNRNELSSRCLGFRPWGSTRDTYTNNPLFFWVCGDL